MKQVCAWATLASKRVVLSRRGREQKNLRRVKLRNPRDGDERTERRSRRTKKEKNFETRRFRLCFAAGEKKISLSSSFFFEEGEASEGRNEEEDSNRQTQCHQRVKLIIDDHLEKVIEEMRS